MKEKTFKIYFGILLIIIGLLLMYFVDYNLYSTQQFNNTYTINYTPSFIYSIIGLTSIITGFLITISPSKNDKNKY